MKGLVFHRYLYFVIATIATPLLAQVTHVVATAAASDKVASQNHANMDHSMHMKYMQQEGSYKVSHVNYVLPDTALKRMDGSSTTLGKVLHTSDGVMLNFIFTSCTSICPTMSAIFSAMDKRISASGKPIKLVSISIDPEFDTPKNLHKYANKFHASNHWEFFTGKLEDIIELQKKMDAYRGNKMNHFPATYIRHANSEEWLKIDGFIVAPELEKQYEKLSVIEAAK